MDSLIDKISLRELLKSFLPAYYFIIFIIPFIDDKNICNEINFQSMDIFNFALIVIFVASFGVLISAIDMPKRFPLFKNILPNKRIAKEVDDFKKAEDIDINYYQFCNTELSAEEKMISQKYTNYYHFCFNIAVLSFILLILYLFFSETPFLHSYALPIGCIFIISIVGVCFLLYGKGKITYHFNRTYIKYKTSDYYKKIMVE